MIELKENTFVTLEVFNSIGQKVAMLVNRELSAGSTNIKFDASKLTTGVYFYQLTAKGINLSKKMMLIK